MPVAWEPTLAQVAVYAPWLTVNTKVPGSQGYLMTFSAQTSPDDTVAGQHVDDAVTMITGRITTMPAALYPLATVVAARYAAATLALAYARTDEDRQRADALWASIEAALDELEQAADNAGASALSPLPVGYAPEPVGWGDSLLIDSNWSPPGQRVYWQ